MFVAKAKAQLPLVVRSGLNAHGVYCRLNRLPDGVMLYQAGGKLITRLRFTVEKDGSSRAQKYQPGDWERNLDFTYDKARFLTESAKVSRETEEKRIAVEEKLESMKKVLSVVSYLELMDEPGITRLELRKTREYLHKVGISISSTDMDDEGTYVTTVVKEGTACLEYIGYEGKRRQTVLRYDSDDWEREIALAYQVYAEELKDTVGTQLPDEVGLNAKATQVTVELKIGGTEAIERLEGLLNKNPNRAYAWAILYELYMILQKFKDAQKAATAAVELNPQEALYHFNLSTLYYVALTKSKVSQDSVDRFRLATLDLKIPPELRPTREQEEWENQVRRLTLETLGCSYDYAHRMAVHHCSEALRLSRDREEIRVASSQLASLRRLDQM
jgi:hypothetical protein